MTYKQRRQQNIGTKVRLTGAIVGPTLVVGIAAGYVGGLVDGISAATAAASAAAAVATLWRADSAKKE